MSQLRDYLRCLKELERVPHSHFNGHVRAEETCHICSSKLFLWESIDELLGPEPAAPKTAAEFEQLIFNSPSYKAVYDLGRRHERERHDRMHKVLLD